MVSLLLLRCLAEACGMDVPMSLQDAFSKRQGSDQERLGLFTGEAAPVRRFVPHAHPISQLIDPAAPVNSVAYTGQGVETPVRNMPLRPGTAVFPGSFNPAHQGHTDLATAALHWLEQHQPTKQPPQLFYEISVVNADKPPLEIADVESRVQQFFASSSSSHPDMHGVNGSNPDDDLACSNARVVVTNQPLYFSPADGGGKAKLFPGCVFVVGVDTAVRILNTK
jgi:hypothetical protein